MKTVTEMLKTMTAEEVIAAKPILSVAELTADLKYHGMKTCEMTERSFILADKYPFASGVDTGRSRICKIYTKPYIAWLDKMFGVSQRA